MTMMKAIVQEGYGPADQVLRLADVEKPIPAADEVLIRIHSASVHADVWHVVNGFPYVLRLMGSGLNTPKNPIPGIDMAGIIESVGADVTQFKPGDAIFGETHRGLQWVNGGAYAEYVATPSEILALKPENVTFEQAASVPTSGMIALQNLQSVGLPEPGQQVLVNGAGGGVGSITVQLAKAYGATVTAVDSGEKFDMLRSLGADYLIDYTQENFLQADRRYDLIFDVASNLRFSDCKKALTSTGKYLVIGHDHYGTQGHRVFGSIPKMVRLMARAAFTDHLPDADFAMPDKHSLLDELREFLAAGKITPVIDRSFALSQAPEAIRYLTEGRALGRIVINIDKE